MRGSSLLLAGRFVAYGVEFLTQVLLVRYLAKGEFGAFAYALSVIVVLKSIAVLELPNTVGRFIPLYRERREYDRLMGSAVLAIATIATVGVLLAVGLYVAVGPFGLRPTSDPEAIVLMVALGLLIPLEGLDALLTTLFATLTGAAQIAFRQVLAPVLKFGLVLALMFAHAGTLFLAVGYVVVAALSLLVYGYLLVRAVRQQPWLPAWRPRQLTYPVREVFSFAMPLLASTLVWALMESSDAVLLGLFRGTDAVAEFRAVLPLPRVLGTLTLTFGVLYTPLAAQLYARGQHGEVADLYRRVALWMTVLTFPVFVLAFSFAPATTVGLYGDRYAGSAPVMAVLAVGYYFFALTGFNGFTLKVYRKLRYAITMDIAAALLNIVVNLILIPRFGAMGAATGTAVTLLVHNALKQYGLWRYLRINLFQRRYLIAYASVFGVALLLLAVQWLWPLNLWLALLLGGVASLFVVWLTRDMLEIDTVFPELRRLPGVAAVLGRNGVR